MSGSEFAGPLFLVGMPRSGTKLLRSLLNAHPVIGIPEVEDQLLQDAVDYAAFGNMRKMEMENKLASERLAPGDNKDPESFKTRKGKVGGYTEYLSDAQIAELNHKMATQLSDQLGYNDALNK